MMIQTLIKELGFKELYEWDQGIIYIRNQNEAITLHYSKPNIGYLSPKGNKQLVNINTKEELNELIIKYL